MNNKNEYRVLVCGGRNYNNINMVYKVLCSVLSCCRNKGYTLVIIQGGAKGADYMADKWAKENNIKSITFKADWDKYSKAAGAIRNQNMLNLSNPNLVIAFPGGNGTKDMINRAKTAQIDILPIV